MNNLGCAKCVLAKFKNDKALYESGMKDFQTSINIDANSAPKEWLTAYKNLKWAEEEIGGFQEKDFNGQLHDKFFKSVS